MSEYQYVHFLALDRPLDEKQLAYMETQSSRAEVTKWEFTNEYHYGDFHGNAHEMLRRGYDVHLHYANYGTRRLMFRLPAGLPWDRQTFEAYLPEDGIEWHPDKQGRGGILEIQPDGDADSFGDDMIEPDALLAEIAPVRDLFMTGDLRSLYVLWLALNNDDEALEPPLPAGMNTLPKSLVALADFYDVGDDLLEAAAEGSPPLPKAADADAGPRAWLDQRSKAELRELVQRFLVEDAMGVRRETLSLIRDQAGATAWPATEPTRTFQQLHQAAEEMCKSRSQRAAKAKEQARRSSQKKMAANPQAVIDQVEILVCERSTRSYEAAAEILTELREALGPTEGPPRVQAIAESLRQKHPSSNVLISVLRKHGLLVKTKRSTK